MLKKLKSVSGTAWGVIAGIVAFIGIAGTVWGISSYWHGYCAEEVIHEARQDEDILAGKQDRMQQRIQWLNMQVIDYTKMYGCDARWVQHSVFAPAPAGNHQCKGIVWEQFQKIVHDLQNQNMKLNKMTGG